MLQSYPHSLELEAAGKRSRWKNNLSNLSDNKLVEIIVSAEEKFRDKKISFFEIADQHDEFYMGAAAVDILRERHGPYYVEEKLGFQQPFLDKLLYKTKKYLKQRLKKLSDSVNYILDFPLR